jgi:hypothetical protein
LRRFFDLRDAGPAAASDDSIPLIAPTGGLACGRARYGRTNRPAGRLYRKTKPRWRVGGGSSASRCDLQGDRLRHPRNVHLHGGRLQGSEHLLNDPPPAIERHNCRRDAPGRSCRTCSALLGPSDAAAREACRGRTTNRSTPTQIFLSDVEGRRSETAPKRSERQAVRSRRPVSIFLRDSS